MRQSQSGHKFPLIVAAAIALACLAAPATADPGHPHGKPATANEPAGEAAPKRSGTALLMPIMDPARGRKLFASKGCVVCHVINGIGGNHGPSLDMGDMAAMNPFDFAAKMWRGADIMIVLQEEELGEKAEFDGQDLADIIAFVHSRSEIAKFSEQDVPHKIMDVLKQMHGGKHRH